MNEELKEWLGVKPADFYVYAALGAVVSMYFTQSVALDIALAVVAVIFGVISCVIGMRPETGLSATTNFLKRVSYPLWVVAALVCVYLNFTRWNAL